MNFAHIAKQYIAVPAFLLIICLYIGFYNLDFDFDSFLISAIVAIALYIPFKVLKLFFHKEYGKYPDAHVAHDRILILVITLWIVGIAISYVYLHDLKAALGAGIILGIAMNFTLEGVIGEGII